MTHLKQVRLDYRPLNQLDHFKIDRARPGAEFCYPRRDINDSYDLMYYFEVVNDTGGGWFEPDPLSRTPYFVVSTAIRR